MARKKAANSNRYKNADFLRALGEHCRKLRVQKGYSIDRMAKESDQLSPSVIHRLETGAGAVTVAALFRYAQVLELKPKALLDFEFHSKSVPTLKLLSGREASVREKAFKSLLPVYSLKAAAGHFGRGEDVSALGWIEATEFAPLDERMFVVQAEGESMQPKIQDGDWLVMRADPAGTRQGKIVLAQYHGPADPDTGGSYTVKKYSSAKVAAQSGEWRHREVRLQPLNPAYEPIVLRPEDEDDFRIVAECLGKLKRP